MTKSGKTPDSLSELSQRKAERIERCWREAKSCRLAQANPNLTLTEKLGALQGEVDWLVALQMAEEEMQAAGDGVSLGLLPFPDGNA